MSVEGNVGIEADGAGIRLSIGRPYPTHDDEAVMNGASGVGEGASEADPCGMTARKANAKAEAADYFASGCWREQWEASRPQRHLFSAAAVGERSA